MSVSNEDYKQSQLYKIRHSAAHVMAQAVCELYPDAKIAFGPPIKNGFYYDFDMEHSLQPEDFKQIEATMKKIVKKKHVFSKKILPESEAKEFFKDQPYKLEQIDTILSKGTDEYGEPLPEGEKPALSIYTHDTFNDLCGGPHIQNTGEINIKAVKLMSVAGAYWRGDEKRPMLQRIYATAFETKDELYSYTKRLEEAKKRDHRALGKKLDLFSTSEAVGPGLTLWHPKGGMVRYLAERFSQKAHLENGYEWVYTPHIGRSTLWETSGHLDFYKDSMYSPMDIDGENFYLKPMNCPFHIQIFKSSTRSYRDLPIRYAEFGSVYRYELSGTLHGLTRVRGFTQDDAHIFCLPEQVEEEIHKALNFSLYVLKTFGFKNFKAYVSTKPEEKSIGEDAKWDSAIDTIKKALEKEGIEYDIDLGGGAFYGPKIDLKIKDSLEREWQLSTIQFDFNLPERFGLSYIGSDNKPHVPVMIHRALFGSIERFLGLLIEHYAGIFPLWLAPEQVRIIPITEGQLDYAHDIKNTLKTKKFRVSVDGSNDRLNAKIRKAQLEKIPYIFILGEKEIEAKNVAVRKVTEGDIGAMTLEAFIEMVASELIA